jgi:hypothetical protein
MKTFLSLAMLVVAVSACGPTDAQVGDFEDEVGAYSAELSTRSSTYVRLRRDTRRCASPLCGGFWVHDVNRGTLREQYVSGLDFTASGLSDEVQADVYNAPDGEVVLYGKLGPLETRFNTRPFIVTAAWRGLPGVKPAPGESFYRVEEMNVQCLVAPCPTLQATKLHSTSTTVGTSLDTSRARLPRVDETWLADRVLRKGALVTGRFRPGSSLGINRELVLDASQVFIKLPDMTQSCPRPAFMQCPSGKVLAMQRNADRCIMPAGCVEPGFCAAYYPSCAPGYTLVEWTGGMYACPQYACDPDFLFD